MTYIYNQITQLCDIFTINTIQGVDIKKTLNSLLRHPKNQTKYNLPSSSS